MSSLCCDDITSSRLQWENSRSLMALVLDLSALGDWHWVSESWLDSDIFWHMWVGHFSGYPWNLLRQKLGRVWKSSIFFWEARWDLKGFSLPSICCKEEDCYLVCTLSPLDTITESSLPFLLPDIAYVKDCWSENPNTNRHKYMKAFPHLSKIEQVPTLRRGDLVEGLWIALLHCLHCLHWSRDDVA